MKAPHEMAARPVKKIQVYLKYGRAITEHQHMNCPGCGHVLNAGPNYQPEYCDQCGQRITFDNVEWKPDRHIGYISVDEETLEERHGEEKKL